MAYRKIFLSLLSLLSQSNAAAPLVAPTSLVVSTSAIPTSSINPTCAAVSEIISKLHLYPPASSFCSGFLHYTTSTQTLTITATATIWATATATAIASSTAVNTAITSINATVTAIVTSPLTQAFTVTAPTLTITSVNTQLLTVTANPVTLTTSIPSVATVASGVTTVYADLTAAPVINKRDVAPQVKPASPKSVRSSTTLTTSTKVSSSSSYNPTVTSKASSASASASASTSTYALSSCVNSYAKNAISSACSCLVPTPKASVTIPATATATAIATNTVTSLAVTTITTTVTAVASVTVTGTATQVVIVSATYTPSTTVFPTATLIATTVPTVNITPTITSVVPSTTYATPTGLQFGVYQNLGGDEGDSSYSGFDPAYFKTQQPFQNGTIDQVGPFDFQPGSISIYGGPSIDSNSFVVDHRAYILAPQNGDYTINVQDVDDIILVWHGAIAYAGWTRSNADIVGTWPAPPSPVTFTLTQGQYYPIRIMYGQAQDGLSLDISITAPDGSTIIINGQTTNYVVTGSCDGTTAPPFPPYGAEP